MLVVSGPTVVGPILAQVRPRPPTRSILQWEGIVIDPIGAILAIFLGALVGSIVFLPITLRTRKLVPFGIFLAVGAAVAEGWGDLIVRWYSTTYLGA